MAGQLDGFFNSMIVNFYYAYLLLKKIREINDLRKQLDATNRMRSLVENRVRVLEWIQNLGPFQQVEEETKERRTHLCCKYIHKMSQNDHPINFLKPRTATSGHSYNLQASDNNRNIVYADRSCCRTQCSGSFVSFAGM